MVEDLGERKIIEIIIGCLDQMPNMPIPFGDDVSAVDIGGEKLAILKTDMLVSKTDIPFGMSLRQAARKAVVMNVSDLAAKGVEPIAILASIGVPRGLTKREIEQIGKGLNEGAREYNTYVLGGDTNEALDFVICCIAFGICEKNILLKRSGAKPGDIVAFTGYLGKTTCGLKVLLEDFSAPPKIRESLVKAVVRPHARLKEGIALSKTRAVTACIDSSDGLAWSLHEISRASKVGFIIDNLPVDRSVEEFAEIHDLDPVELSLYGGEEYELLMTINPRLWGEVQKAMSKIDSSLIRMGRVTEKRGIILERGEKTSCIEARGWEHFKTI